MPFYSKVILYLVWKKKNLHILHLWGPKNVINFSYFRLLGPRWIYPQLVTCNICELWNLIITKKKEKKNKWITFVGSSPSHAGLCSEKFGNSLRFQMGNSWLWSSCFTEKEKFLFQTLLKPYFLTPAIHWDIWETRG